MDVSKFVTLLGADFFTGVPDSQLKALCDYLIDTYGIDPMHHIIAANEGNCTALAAGYHLATGKVPVVYLQNSGEGNIINPLASLLNEKVYAIPCLFVIGWRGEPGVHDEPQHVYQGEVTLKLMEDMGVTTFVVDQTTKETELAEQMKMFRGLFQEGHCAAFVVRKGALTFGKKIDYTNEYGLAREDAIRMIAAAAEEAPIISTTGKASRELFEIREQKGQSHECDFLTVGCMGHASSIALGVALQRPSQKVWCIDGDGAALMHLGAMGVIGANAPQNFVHVIINNGAHETVGGMPTVMPSLNLSQLAKACGYQRVLRADSEEALQMALQAAKEENSLVLIEVCCANGARADLGRPTTTPVENKNAFMRHLQRQ